MSDPLVIVKGLKKSYPQKMGVPKIAVDNLSFEIARGKTLGLIGESGCGKSTTGRCLLRLEQATEGEIWIDGQNVPAMGPKELFQLRRQAQIIFQDPYSSLDPRMTAGEIIAEPLHVHKISGQLEKAAHELLDLVGLPKETVRRYPHELSGGQRQRISIARALALKPQFLICDEPLSALDVSIQAQIVNLLKNLQRELNLTYLFIAHDLALVKYLSDEIAVMQAGRIIEKGPSDILCQNPQHSHTKALLAAHSFF